VRNVGNVETVRNVEIVRNVGIVGNAEIVGKELSGAHHSSHLRSFPSLCTVLTLP